MMKLRIFVCVFVLIGAASFVWGAAPGNRDSTYNHYLKALILESQGNLQGARDEMELALKLEPESAYLNHMAAELAFFLGQLPKARDLIEKVIVLKPDSTKAYLLAGQIYWSMADLPMAEKNLRQAVELAPNDSQPLVSLAMAVTARDPEEAIKLYKNFLIKNPDEVEIRERLGQLYRNKGDLANAKTTWEKALEYDPDSLRAHLALAQIAEVNYDTATAISHYEAVLNKDPNNLPLLLRVGELRYRNNEMTEALKAFSKATEIAPASASANFWRALMHEHMGEWKQAIGLLKKVADKSPEVGVLLRLSYYYTQLGTHGQAISILEGLAKSEPENADFLNYLAIAYEQDQKYEKAIKAMLKLIDLDDQNAEYQFYLSTLYDRTKRFPKAEIHLKKAIELNSNYAIAFNYLGYTYADLNRNLQEAETLVQRALALDPENGAYLDSMGWVYYRLGQYKKSEDFLQRALLKGQDPLIWEHLGTVHEVQGHLSQAILAWDESLHLKSDQKKLRAKVRKLLQSLNEHKRMDLFVKRMTANFNDVKDMNSLVQISVCEGKPCVQSRGEFQYSQNEKVKVEIPGPLAGPLLLVTKPYGKSVQYGALNPVFQTLEYYVTRAISRLELILNGDLFGEIDLEALDKNVKVSNGKLVASTEDVTLTFNGKEGFVEKVEWHKGKDKETLIMSRYSELRWPAIPLQWEWRDGTKNFSIKLGLKNPVVTTTMSPLPPPKGK